MASHPIPPANTEAHERPLTQEEGWALFWSLEGSMKNMLREEGGPSEVLRKEREAWGE